MLTRRVHTQNKNLRRIKGTLADVDLRVFGLNAPEADASAKATRAGLMNLVPAVPSFS